MELVGIKKISSVLPDWSVHDKKELKSQLLFRLTSVLVPVPSHKSIIFSVH